MRRVLLLSLLLTAPAARAQARDAGPTAPARPFAEDVDLDGDGVAERVALTTAPNNDVVLTAGAARHVVPDYGDCECVTVAVVDLDAADTMREVVLSSGPTEEQSHELFAYEKGQLRRIGELSADTVEYRGSGIVLVDRWQGFWTQRDKLLVGPGRRGLRAVPQELYAVGVEAKVRTSFLLQHSRTSRDVVANVAVGSDVTILAAAPPERDFQKRWYLVRTSTGLLGWVREQTLGSGAVLPYAR